MTNVIDFAIRCPPSSIAPTRAPSNSDIADGLSDEKLGLLEAAYHSAAMLASEDPSDPTEDELEDLEAIRRFTERFTKPGW